MLVDSHCHLDFTDFADDLDGVMARAAEAGVGWMLTISTHVSRFDGVLAIAERYSNVFCTVGVHPHEVDREPAVSPERLIRMAEHPKVVGFGETGLDYFYEHSSKEAQQRSFRTHIEAARRTGLPLVIHTRNADTDMAAILAEEQGRGYFPGLLHCFSSGEKLAEAALELGFFLSFSGIVTFKKADSLRKIAAKIPLERLLVETDAPFLAPEPKRGKRNEPAFVAHTASCVAKQVGRAPEALAKTTTENFFRLFAKASNTTGRKA